MRQSKDLFTIITFSNCLQCFLLFLKGFTWVTSVSQVWAKWVERERKRGKCTQVHGHTTCGPGIIIIVAYVTCGPISCKTSRHSSITKDWANFTRKIEKYLFNVEKKSIGGKSHLHRQVQNENAQDVKGGWLYFFLNFFLFSSALFYKSLVLPCTSSQPWTWLTETFDDAHSNDTPVKVGESPEWWIEITTLTFMSKRQLQSVVNILKLHAISISISIEFQGVFLRESPPCELKRQLVPKQKRLRHTGSC